MHHRAAWQLSTRRNISSGRAAAPRPHGMSTHGCCRQQLQLLATGLGGWVCGRGLFAGPAGGEECYDAEAAGPALAASAFSRAASSSAKLCSPTSCSPLGMIQVGKPVRPPGAVAQTSAIFVSCGGRGPAGAGWLRREGAVTGSAAAQRLEPSTRGGASSAASWLGRLRGSAPGSGPLRPVCWAGAGQSCVYGAPTPGAHACTWKRPPLALRAHPRHVHVAQPV